MGRSHRLRVVVASGVVMAGLAFGVPSAGAAPGGGHGGGGGGNTGPAFTVGPTHLTFSTPLGTSQNQTLTLLSGKKAIAVSTATDTPFADAHTGTCWTSYLGKGKTIPSNTGCTIDVLFTATDVSPHGSFIIVTLCDRFSTRGGVVTCSSLDQLNAVAVQLNGQGHAPDLDIAGIQLGDGGNTACGYVVIVRNLGNDVADLTGVGVQGYFVPSQVYDSNNGDPAGGQTFNSGTTLQPFTTVPITVGSSACQAAGDLYLAVRVDNSGVLTESDEQNNTFFLSLAG